MARRYAKGIQQTGRPAELDVATFVTAEVNNKVTFSQQTIFKFAFAM